MSLGATDTDFNFDQLIAGDFTLVSGGVTVKSGDNLKRGTVLGKLTSGGQVRAVDSTKSDGTEDPYAVLAQDTDATSSDTVAPAYLTGEFNENKLIFGGTDDADTHREAMRALSMFIKTPVVAA